MTEAEQILNTLRQTSNPVGSALIRRIIRVLEQIAAPAPQFTGAFAVLDQILEVTGLYACELTDLPGAIEDIISNLAIQNAVLANDTNADEHLSQRNLSVDETLEVVAKSFCDIWPDDDADRAAELEEVCACG